jgi:urease accessory protein
MTDPSRTTTSAALLLLADSRLPAGGHAHSGGVEQAVATGRVHDLTTLEAFLRGRLSSAGVQAGSIAAFACLLTGRDGVGGSEWSRLDQEVSARMPSPAQRQVSRAQGRALMRVTGRVWPAPVLSGLGERPHHAVVQGVAVALIGGGPHDAALLAASSTVTGPASAALRLLGLDPVEVTGLVARLGTDIDLCATGAAVAGAVDDPVLLPAPALPMLDVLAENHARSEVKLFAS